MRVLASIVAAFALVVSVNATALTTLLNAGDKQCFFADVDSVGEKIGFYFAVQSGGNFEIDWVVLDPNDKVVMEEQGERGGDYIFTAQVIGEYTFCFANEGVTVDKLIDLDIMVESEPRRALSSTQSQLKDHTSALEESVHKLRGLLQSIERMQKFSHTRHHRNYSTVISTQNRLFWFTVLECVAVIAMSLAQIWILKTFFARSGGRRWRV